MIIRKNRLKVCLSLFLAATILPAQVCAGWFTELFQNTEAVKAGIAAVAAAPLVYKMVSTYQKNHAKYASEIKHTPEMREQKEQSEIIPIDQNSDGPVGPSDDALALVPYKAPQSFAGLYNGFMANKSLCQEPIAKPSKEISKEQKISTPQVKQKVVKKSKNKAGAQVIADTVITGTKATAFPAVTAGAQYITGNNVVAVKNIIPNAQFAIATAMVNKLHGIKEGTEAIDTAIGAALVGTATPMVPVYGAIAEVSAIVNEVIALNGGIGKIAADIDWFQVALATKNSNKYNAGLIKEIQKLTKNEKAAQVLTTVTIGALENAVMYSVLGLLGITTGGTGLVAVAGGAATYGAIKGLVDCLVFNTERKGVIAGTIESAALKHALEIGGSLAAADALPIIVTELAVGIVQTMVDQAGGWKNVSKKVGSDVVKATQKRLSLYKKGIALALEKLEKVAKVVGEDIDTYVNQANCGPFPLEADTPVISDKPEEITSKKKGWISSLFENPAGSFDDDEFEASLESDDEDIFYECDESGAKAFDSDQETKKENDLKEKSSGWFTSWFSSKK